MAGQYRLNGARSLGDLSVSTADGAVPTLSIGADTLGYVVGGIGVLLLFGVLLHYRQTHPAPRKRKKKPRTLDIPSAILWGAGLAGVTYWIAQLNAQQSTQVGV